MAETMATAEDPAALNRQAYTEGETAWLLLFMGEPWQSCQ